MDLILVSISFKTAPMEMREGFSLSHEDTGKFLLSLAAQDGVSECLAVSTCNRTEVYSVCSNGFNEDSIIKALLDYKGVVGPVDKNIFYCRRNLDAARHVFRVSAGLESQVVGENQILGQMKEAYSRACELKTTMGHLNKLFHMAFRVGKIVRSKTGLSAGATSIASAAVELASLIYETLKDKSVLLVGAGETGELVARHLLARGVGRMLIANRTRQRAEEIAVKYGEEVMDFENIAGEFFENDIVITATSSQGYVITTDALRDHVGQAGSKKVMAIDISMPRGIDPEVAGMDNVFLYNMDDLKTVVDKNLKMREKEIPKALEVIEGVVGEYKAWCDSQRAVPTIKFLKERFEGIRAAEVVSHKHCADCSKRVHVDYLTRRIINKILSTPFKKLAKDTGLSEQELNYLRGLFTEEGGE